MYKVMIVDDEIVSQDILADYIRTRQSGYTVVSICSNGQEALDAFQENPADIVLVDIRMPVMDGLTLIEKMNKLSNTYIPIVISSYGEFEYAKSAMSLGVVHYLLKPIDFRELDHSLEAAGNAIKFQQLTRSSLSLKDENQELYFDELLSGQYSEKMTAQQLFATLSFPFKYDDCNGIQVRIDFTQTESWAYGKETLSTAIYNLLYLLYSPQFLIRVFSKHSSFHFLMIDKHYADFDFNQLITEAKQLFHIKISVEPVAAFSSIEQLRINSLSQVRHKIASQNASFLVSDDDNAASYIAIQKAIAYMETHYNEDLSRDDIAAKVYMSGAHFSRCFKIVTQTTYKDYITKIRMQKALELLETNAKISDIAKQVGYSNPNRFNVNFRQYTSYTPSEYRSQVLQML